MPANPAQTTLIFFSFSVVALYGPALLAAFGISLYLLRRKTRVARRQEKHRRIREKIEAKGKARRDKLARDTQRRNIGELAAIVRQQLETNKKKMSPYMHQRTSVFIEKAVTTVDFDRLMALHHYFDQTETKQIPLVMDLFFEQTR